jgi:hypothetical protein
MALHHAKNVFKTQQNLQIADWFIIATEQEQNSPCVLILTSLGNVKYSISENSPFRMCSELGFT